MERPDVDRLVAELRLTVSERRRSGEYPDGLESDLGRHFELLAAAPRRQDPRFEALLRGLEEAADFRPGRISMGSSLPLGAPVHRLIGKLTSRQTRGVLEQVQGYSVALRELVVELIAALPGQGAGGRGAGAPSRIAVLEATQGPRDRSLEEHRALLPWLAAQAPVLVLGCGRGEMLELLQEAGVECRGFDSDPELVADCSRRGLPALLGDGLGELASLPEGALGGIVGAGLIEQLSAGELLELALLASRRLRPGGRLVLRALNPAAQWVLAHSPGRPVPADYLARVLGRAGFSQVDVVPGPATPEAARLEPLPAAAGLDEALRGVYNRNVDRLNEALFGPRTYLCLATR